ncbi:hypothetical protein Q0Z83_013070 [Actinoplanes sichuanensis]|uniref:Uncharacterized protein n=1 Tax=Actinoplanes sichuanensis TaxID=512349 RepID=A0ABW4A4C5_9ACTN|nr:hypothetical protein [Actinoplanes sichuanensis]BEL03116.1 hypothetical protein Q0Z83_013070 [Actinoplanes sichuanensis]
MTIIILAAAAVTGTRWLTAGDPVAVAPPAGATETLPEGAYELVVDLRSSELHQDLRSERGPAQVNTYAMPAGTTWEQVRSAVAGRLDGWKQAGDCPDSGRRRLWCTWTEPANWWPRQVRIVFLRAPSKPDPESPWPDNTFLLIGSGPGGNV